MSVIISLSNIEKYYGEYHALRDIDLEIREGEFFSLLGPSGCGKTTLLRVIAGFEEVSSGTVLIGGQNMAHVPANKRPTNMVFQSYAIFPHLNVAQNVGFGLRRAALSKDEKDGAVAEALKMVGLEGFGNRAAHALSGGQRQRVALARALVLQPKVLLLDEPLSALDKKMREQMQSELRRLQRQVGITFILVTHDQEEALIMSDRIAVMFEGQIAQLAAPQQLYRHPVTRRVGEFIGVMNFLEARQVDEIPDGVELEIEGLGRIGVTSDQMPEGTRGLADVIGLRPEALSLVYDGQVAPAHVAEGEIIDRAYYGDMTYYDVKLAGCSTPVTLSMKNLMSRQVLEPGAHCRVAWEPGSLVLFSAD